MKSLINIPETKGKHRASRKALSIIMMMSTSAIAQAEDCSVVGTWKDNFEGVRTVPETLVGTTKFPYCTATHTMTVTLVGNTGFKTNNRYNGGGGDCVGFVETMSFNSGCASASGRYLNDGQTADGPITWTRTEGQMQLKLERTALTTAEAKGDPAGGSFSHSAATEEGDLVPTVAMVAGGKATDNPNKIEFKAPANKGGPKQGGRIRLTSKYTLNGKEVANNLNTVVSFGMSCYMVALEADYGAGPDNCSKTRISGKVYEGTVTDPQGMTGTFCSAFIANIRLQGTGQLNNGDLYNYNPSTKTFKKVPNVTGSDNTPVVAGATVARDPAIIPAKGVLVDVDGVGNGLLANDKGGHIIGYRLDLFKGAGKAVCANYANPVGVGACTPAQGATCPERTFK